MKKTHFSKDIREFLYLLDVFKVKYLIVGGEAVIFYGYARLTGDIDIFYETSGKNVDQLFSALKKFWSGTIPNLNTKEELKEPGVIFQFGVSPNRIDLINQISGVTFKKAWQNREVILIERIEAPVKVNYIGINELIQNKKATGRFKDMDDLRFLEKIQSQLKPSNPTREIK